MKKTLRFMLVSLLTFVVGSIWAADVYYTLDTTVESNQTNNNNYAGSGTITVDGIEWALEGNGKISPWRIGGKNITATDREVYTKTPMDAAINSIDLTVGAASSITVNSLKLIVASDADFANVIDEVTRTFVAESKITFAPTAGTSWANDAYYKFVFNVTVSGSSNKFVQFKKVEFYAESGSTPSVAKPVFSPTGGTFLGSQEVTLTCETEGAKVYYTLDGTDPTTESTEYTAPFSVTETTTVKAIAVKDSESSEVASATYTAIPTTATLAELNALENNATFAYSGEALVVAKPTAKYVYVKDATGSSLIYDTTGDKTTAAEVGKTIAANWTGKVSIYNKLFELVPDENIEVKDGDAVKVTYPVVTATDITAEHINEVVTLKGITGYTVNGKNLTITIGETNIVGYNQFGLEIAAAEEGKTYEMVGAISRYNDNIQFQPIEIKEEAGIELPEIVNADFNPEADPLGWDKVTSAQYYDLGMGLIGTYQVRGEHPAATVDETHLATEFAAGLECRWQTNYAAFTQTTAELPAGAYKLTFDVENTNATTTQANYENRFFVKVGETTYNDESTEWMNGKSAWTTHTITFTLTEASPITISLGYGTGSNNFGVGNTPAIYVSHLQLTTFDPLADAKATLQDEITAAEALLADETKTEGREAFSTAINTAKTALAEATTLEALEAALNTLKAAETDFAWAQFNIDNPSGNLLVNGSFDTANQGWTLTNMGYQQNAERPTRYAEKWTSAANNGHLSGEVSAKQTIANVPAGAYVLKAVVNAQQQDNKELEITGATLYMNDNIVATSGAWKEYTIVYNHKEKGNIEVGFKAVETNANWVGIDEFSLVYYGDYDTYVLGAPKKNYKLAKDEAEAALAAEANANVTGDEKTALEAEIAKTEPTTVEAYEAATAALKAATKTFTDAAASYNALATANALITDLPYAKAEKKPEAKNATNAAAAATAANEVYSALRAYYESNAKAENVDGAEDKTALITNPDATDGNNGWTIEGSMNNPRNNESWTDSEGNNSYMYFDGGNWGGNSWTTTMKQTVTLPIGKYLLTAKGRASANVTTTLSVGEVSTEMAHVGSTGNVFARGWADSFIEFETPNATESEQVEIVVTASANAVHEWFSVGDFRLTKLKSIVTGIETVKAETAQKAIYNLNGQKVMKAQKGLYILNGKKVVVK